MEITEIKVVEDWRTIREGDNPPPHKDFSEAYILHLEGNDELTYCRRWYDAANLGQTISYSTYGVRRSNQTKPLALFNMVNGQIVLSFVNSMGTVAQVSSEDYPQAARFFSGIAKELEFYLPFFKCVPAKSRIHRFEIGTLEWMMHHREKYDSGRFEYGDDLALFVGVMGSDSESILSVDEVLERAFTRAVLKVPLDKLEIFGVLEKEEPEEIEKERDELEGQMGWFGRKNRELAIRLYEENKRLRRENRHFREAYEVHERSSAQKVSCYEFLNKYGLEIMREFQSGER